MPSTTPMWGVYVPASWGKTRPPVSIWNRYQWFNLAAGSRIPELLAPNRQAHSLNRHHSNRMAPTLGTGFIVARTQKTSTLNSYICASAWHIPIIPHHLYHRQNEGTLISDRIHGSIDDIFPKFSSDRFDICGDFNMRHKKWFVYSNKTDEEGRYYRDLSIAYELAQIIEGLGFNTTLRNA